MSRQQQQLWERHALNLLLVSHKQWRPVVAHADDPNI